MTYSYTTPDKLPDILRSNNAVWAASGRKQRYLNTPISFDIETTSFYQNEKKCACMYVWALDIFGVCIIGRTWDEFTNCILQISKFYRSNVKNRVLIYVHNLAYEFQFFRKYFEWENVFSIRERKPLYALTKSGVEFRCSYLLSGYKLSTVGEMLRHPISKCVGDLDYEKPRHAKTELSFEELQYCIHDVKIVSQYIREKIEDESGICNIPYTKTGYVRRMCRHRCVYGKKGTGYRVFIHDLTLTADEYITAKRAFSGGFTHAGFLHVGKVCNNVSSFDFTSSYPAVMIAEKYPITKGKLITKMSIDDFYNYIKNYLCVFTIEIHNVKSTFFYEHYISRYKCSTIESNENVKCVFNNGRVCQAGRIITTITSIDFEIIKKTYDFDIIGFTNFYIYKAGYLPTAFVNTIIDLYEDKTKLKGIAGKEEQYLSAKENINSMYGMCVTDIFRELCDYDTDKNEWDDSGITIEERYEKIQESIEKENTKHGRFLFYLWGVFVTAYARRNLWSGILECGKDYIYSDTDSIKIYNMQQHIDFIERYNKWITNKIQIALQTHKINVDRAAPKTKTGKIKPLGVWDFEGTYTHFKTLGAKRYLYQTEDGKLHLTNAGLSKIDGCAYIAAQPDPFAFYNDDMYVPPDHTGKMTHTYIDEPFTAILTDLDGTPYPVTELSYIHLSKQDYHLSLAQDFKDFLSGKHKIDHAE